MPKRLIAGRLIDVPAPREPGMTKREARAEIIEAAATFKGTFAAFRKKHVEACHVYGDDAEGMFNDVLGERDWDRFGG